MKRRCRRGRSAGDGRGQRPAEDEDNNDLGEDDNKQFHQRLNEPVGKAVTKALADLKLRTIVSEDRKSELRVLASALIIEELKSIKRWSKR